MKKFSDDILKDILDSDFDIISNLQTDGPSFLDRCYQYEDINNYRNKIDGYHKMFLSNEFEEFEDGLKSYIDYLKGHETLVWENLVESLTEEELKNFMIEIIDQSRSFSFDNKLNIYSKLFRNSKTKIIIKDDVFWNYDDNNHGGYKEPFMEDLINSIDSTSCEAWQTGIIQLHDFIKSFLIVKDLRSFFIEWFSNIFNDNIRKINLDPSDDIDDLKSDTFLINMFGIFYKFWEKGATDENIKKIDPEYITDSSCFINWFDKEDSDKTYGFLTQVFFLTVNAIRICYVPLINRIKIWTKFLEKLENTKLILIGEGSLLAQMSLPNIYKEIKVVNDIIKEDTVILDNSILKSWIDNFYKKMVFWIDVTDIELPLDDILRDMGQYIINRVKDEENKYIMDKGLCNMALDIVRTGNHARNPDIRYNYLKILEKGFKSFDIGVSEGKDTFPTPGDFLEGIMTLHNDLDSYDGIPILKLSKKSHIYDIIESIYINSKSNELKVLLDNILVKDMTRTKVFINIIFNDLSYIMETIDMFIDHLNKELEEDSDEYKKYTYMTYTLFHKFSHYFEFVINMLDLNTFINIVTSNELISKIGVLLNASIKKIVDEFDIQFKYIKPDELSKAISEGKLLEVNFSRILFDILDIYIKIARTNPKIIDITTENDINFDIKYFEKIINLIDGGKFDIYSYRFSGVKELVSKLKAGIIKSVEKMNIEYPDEFLDPLFCIPIEDPILLPNMHGCGDDLFMEKSVIIQHLLNKHENPYTREELTIEQLEEYNKREDIVPKIENFKIRLNKWIEENN